VKELNNEKCNGQKHSARFSIAKSVIVEDLRSIVEAERKPLLHNLNVELEPGQKAVVVVLDELQSNAIKIAFSLMQGIKAVVDVPLNGEG
jgi:hypothetical protein